jgi:hypothetical protein
MPINWITPAGKIATIVERVSVDMPLEATSPTGPITFTVIAGKLPRGLRIDRTIDYDGLTSTAHIKGSPVEVRTFTTSRFVVRADDGIDIEDRTFSISVDGYDIPEWITREGYLNVGPENAFFILDNAYVNFQLEATDPDLTAGDKLEFFIPPMGGQLPPGLSLSPDGVISGFTDPIFALEYQTNPLGGYDTGSFDTRPLDYARNDLTGYDYFFYDSVTYDLAESSITPRRLSRIYTFAVGVTDGLRIVTRIFKIYVVTEEFLKADNTLVQVDTNIFTADSSKDRSPIWITESNLGRVRANNYVTVYLDVYDPPTLTGSLTYFLLDKNPDGSSSVIPPGLILDGNTGELAGRIPYQDRVSKMFTFTMLAVDFPITLENTDYKLLGDWDQSVIYKINDVVRFNGFVYICISENRNRIPTNTTFWALGVSTSTKTFTLEVIGEIESGINWLSPNQIGEIIPNEPSTLSVQAESLLTGGKVIYKLINGVLPSGLEFLSNGNIIGKVKQYADSNGPGLTRFFYTEDNFAQTPNYDVGFDNAETTFDREFKFKISARDTANASENTRDFVIKVVVKDERTFANLYVRALQNPDKRLQWGDFISDVSIFRPQDLYRYGDPNFGVQSDIKMLVFAGIESVEAVKFVQAMSRNHYRKRILFGDLKIAEAKDPVTQETVYEVIYVEMIDEFEKNGKSISQVIELSNRINSKVLVSSNSITVDSGSQGMLNDWQFRISDSDHQRIFPTSIKNMRKRIRNIGDRSRELLPLWMRSIQDQKNFEPGYSKALVLCYALPGRGELILSRIKNKTSFASRGLWNLNNSYQINDSIEYKKQYYTCIKAHSNKVPDKNPEFWNKNFDFKNIDFLFDRYIIDILGGEIGDKYLAFPKRGENNRE